MELKIITETEYANFLSKDNGKFNYVFQNTIPMKRLRQKNGWKIYLLGIIENSKIIGVAQIGSQKRRLGYNYFDCQYGPVLDFENLKVVNFFFSQLKEFLKNHKASYFRCNPKIVCNQYDNLGKINQEQSRELQKLTLKVKNELEKLGYIHESLKVDTNGAWNMRWFFQKNLENLEVDDLIKSFNSQGKRSTKKALTNQIQVREINFAEITAVKKLLDMSASKQNFEKREVEYYQSLKNEYQEDLFLMLAEINLEVYCNKLQTTINKNDKQIQKLLNSDKKTQLNDLNKNQDNLIKSQAKYQAILAAGEKIIPLSAGVFIKTDAELVYLFGGNDERYQELCSSYALQKTMMEKTIDLQIPIYNFYGVSPLGTENDGVLKFKQGFNGEIIELIGTFDYRADPFKFHLQNILKQMKRVLNFLR